MSLLDRISNPLGRDRSAPEAGTHSLHVTPWAWRDTDAAYVGTRPSDVWLYRQLDVSPLEWEDPRTRLDIGQRLATLLQEVGATSKDLGGGIAQLSRNREFHLVSVTWESVPQVPGGTPAPLAQYLTETFQFVAPTRALLIGVKLRSSAATAMTKAARGGGVMATLRAMSVSALGEQSPDMDAYADDRRLVSEILRRNGARVPERGALRQLESWYNQGKGPGVVIEEARDVLYVDSSDVAGRERIEMSVLYRFDNPVMRAPESMWMLSALTHPNAGACVISVRGELEPATVARARARRSQRRVLSQMEEEAATGDLERAENSQTFQLAQDVENFVLNTSEPLITKTSIVMARRGGDVDESYIDELRERYGIEMQPLVLRQLAALEETLPCSRVRVNPFLQDVSVAMLSYAGLQGHTALGDPRGAYVGLGQPDLTPVFLEFLGAPARNLPPCTAVLGDPGSGKTFLLQMLATQASLAGLPVVFINPKGFDTLAPFAEAVGGTVVKMSALAAAGGHFDPFRFAPTPEMAATYLKEHILSVLGSIGGSSGFTKQQEIALGHGLAQGAMAGARCAAEAVQYVQDAEVRALVAQLAESDATFRLGYGVQPQSRLAGAGGLVLVEFDRDLNFPERGVAPSEYSLDQRIALAAVRLVAKASLEMLAGTGVGGMFILDEAWTFLGSSDGLAMVQRLGRLGRSLNILPIFATQRVDDLIRPGVDLEGYLSRVFAMKISEEREARAALRLVGLEATEQRITWLRNCGPRRGSNGDGSDAMPARALHRDLDNRHAALVVGPVPQHYREAWTTNPEERAARDKARADRAGAGGAGTAPAASNHPE